MKALNETSKRNIVIALIVLVFILGLVLVYVQANTLSDLRAEVEAEEMAVIAAQNRLNRLMQHRENASEYEQRLAFAKRMIPEQPGEENILRYIHRITDDNDLRAVEIRFDGRSEMDGYTAMPLSITVEGSFQNTRSMLRQLLNGERAIRVNNINLNRTGDAGTALRISISANAFYNHGN